MCFLVVTQWWLRAPWANLKDACSLNLIWDFISVCCLQFYMEGQLDLPLLTRFTGILMTVDFRRSEMLRTHRDAVTFLLQTYPTD